MSTINNYRLRRPLEREQRVNSPRPRNTQIRVNQTVKSKLSQRCLVSKLNKPLDRICEASEFSNSLNTESSLEDDDKARKVDGYDSAAERFEQQLRQIDKE